MTEQRQQIQLLGVALGAFAVLSLMLGSGGFVSKDYGALPNSYESTPTDYRDAMPTHNYQVANRAGLATQQVGNYDPNDVVVGCGDRDGDGYFYPEGCGTQVDCDDLNRATNPGVTEVCYDNMDSNCDGNPNDGCCGDGICHASEERDNYCAADCCEGPYHVATADNRCVWSCGAGTQPHYSGECVCQKDHVETGTDQFGRRVCEQEPVLPECPDPSTVQCGMPLNSLNGYGSCEGTGIYCPGAGEVCGENGCAPPSCMTDAECYSGNACTHDVCNAGVCEQEPVLPECPPPSTVACNQPLTSANGCGDCEGTGTSCPDGYVCAEYGCTPA